MAFSLAFRYDVFAASVCITSADEHPSGKDPEVSGVVEKNGWIFLLAHKFAHVEFLVEPSLGHMAKLLRSTIIERGTCSDTASFQACQLFSLLIVR